MSDNVENQVDQVSDNQESAPQYSEVEQKALEMGWRPKDQFDGDEADFIDAKEFIGRKPLYDKIAQQSKQIKNVTAAVEALRVHYTKVRETAVNDAIRALREEKKRAIADGDGELVDAIEQRIDDAKQEVADIKRAAETPIVEDVQQVHPEFASWQAQNKWYVEGPQYMRDFADAQGKRLHSQGLSPSEVLKEVAKLTRQEFPHKFTNPNKADAPAVGSAKAGGRSPKVNDYQLSEQELAIMNKFVRQGIMTKEEYIADLKEINKRKG